MEVRPEMRSNRKLPRSRVASSVSCRTRSSASATRPTARSSATSSNSPSGESTGTAASQPQVLELDPGTGRTIRARLAQRVVSDQLPRGQHLGVAGAMDGVVEDSLPQLFQHDRVADRGREH